MGAIEGGNHVAVGLITAGALAGEGGLLSAAVFWILGEAGLIVAALVVRDKMTSFELHEQIENDNVGGRPGLCRCAHRLRKHHPACGRW